MKNIENILMIGHYVEPPWADGVVNTIKGWSEGLVKYGLKVNVLSSTSNPFRKRLNLNGVRYDYFFGSLMKLRYCPLLYSAKFYRYLIHYLRKKNVDICHFNGLRLSFAASLKFLSESLFGFSFHNMKGVITYLLKKPIERTFDFLTVPDDREKTLLIESGVEKEKVEKIPPAINIEIFSPKNSISTRSMLGISKDAFIILYAGHFKRGRGIEELFQAFRKLKDGKLAKKVYLILAWTGYAEKGYYNKLMKMIENEAGVVILGPQKDMSSLYNSADVVVSPILQDKFVVSVPLNVIEAMSCGKIVISTDIGSISEFLIDEYNGFLVRTGDIDAIYRKLSMVFKEEFDKQKMGERARETILKNFSVEVVAKRLFNFYRSIVRDN